MQVSRCWRIHEVDCSKLKILLVSKGWNSGVVFCTREAVSSTFQVTGCLKWSYQGLAHWCCFRQRFQFKWKFHPRSEGREVETAAEFLCTTIREWHKHKNTKYEVDHTRREVPQNLACNSPPVDPWEPLWLRTVPQSILTNDWVTVNECVFNRRTNLVVKKIASNAHWFIYFHMHVRFNGRKLSSGINFHTH